MNKSQHNNLFCICDNCRTPLILTLDLELNKLPNAHAIRCRHCHHENADLEDFKEYAKRTRNYANN